MSPTPKKETATDPAAEAAAKQAEEDAAAKQQADADAAAEAAKQNEADKPDDPKSNDDGVREDVTDPIEAAQQRAESSAQALSDDGLEPIAEGARYVITSERTDGLNVRTFEVRAANDEASGSRLIEVGDVLVVDGYDPALAH